MAGPGWAPKAQRILVALVGADLVVQYVAGMLTSAYAPAAGFTDSTDFAAYDVHWMNGYVLGILLIVTLVVIARTRNYPNLAIAIVTFAAFLTAAVAGQIFVGAVPNPPYATVLMSVAFLVAFGANMALSFRLMRGVTPPEERPPGASAAGTG